MLLHDLLRQFDPACPLSGLPNSPVTGVQEDSRRILPGNLFIARSGQKTDGSKFLSDAAGRGAIAVLSETILQDSPLPQVRVENAATATSLLAHLVLGRPSESVQIIGVTGTNGKTTTAYLIRHLLAYVNQKCGMVGTVQIDDGRSCREASMTTPSAPEIAELMAAMRDNGCRQCAIEVSSHALHQGRVAGVRFAGAGFTNLTGDHLDYHGTMEDYAAAKAMLFESLDPSAVAVTNAADEASARMVRDCHGRTLQFGVNRDADYQARDIAVTAQGTQFVLIGPDGRAEVQMGLLGRHNIENALLAAALVGEVCKLTVHQIAAGLRTAQGAPGRLQAVRCGQPFAVLVDYAHTDDAMENVLSALRKLITVGKLRVLFGCGGNRDPFKRPRMAKTAEKWADALYVTSDNPRKEDPKSIVDQITGGLSHRSDRVVTVEIDRRTAIEKILSDAAPGDIVLLAGKGHENYQIVGEEKRHFDDVEEAERVLQLRFAVA